MIHPLFKKVFDKGAILQMGDQFDSTVSIFLYESKEEKVLSSAVFLWEITKKRKEECNLKEQ